MKLPTAASARRHGRQVVVYAFLGWLAATPVLGQPADDLQLVCLNSDGAARALPPLAVATPEAGAWQEISASAGPDADIRSCWVWNEVCPPVKRLFGSDIVHACDDAAAASAAVSRAALVVRLSGLDDDPGEPLPSTVTAAPSAMWREVPRSLLPAWSGEARTVRLPRAPGPWRVQACTARRCSRWTEVPDRTGGVSVRLVEARAVRHEITAGGAPVENARFHLLRPGRGGLSQTEILGFERADAEGRVDLDLPAGQSPAILVSSDGLASAAFSTLRDVPDRVELEPGFFVSGRVVNGDGEPIAARLLGRSFVRDGFGLTQLQTGRTGIGGRFRLHGFSAGDATLRAVSEGESGLEAASRLELENSLDLGDIVLGEVEVVWVRIIDALRRSPVAGALVRAADGRQTRTGSGGLSAVEVRYGRELQVTARGYGFAHPRLPVGVGRAPDQPFVIELEPALTVTGTYVAADGLTSAANGRFTARARGAGGLLLSGTVDADGTFSVDLPGGGVWELEFAADNTGPARVEATGAAGEAIDLGIVRGSQSAVVSGYVVGEGYEPLEGASVTSTLVSEFGPLLAPLLGGSPTASSGSEGYFELHGLGAGPAALRVAAEGYAPRRLEVHLEHAVPLDLGTVELARGRQITVRSDTEGGLVELAVGDAAPPEKMTTPLDDREAVFRAVPNGPLAIVVLNGGGQPVCTRRVVEPEGDLAVRCNDRSVRVTGRVTMDGEAVDGTLLWQRRSAKAEVPGGFFRSRSSGLERVEAAVNGLQDLQSPLDGDGTYRLASVLPGEWEVLWMPASGGYQEPHVVDVPAGARGEVVRNIAYDGVSVEGTVFDQEGRPASRVTVEAFPGQPPVMSDSRGSFRMLGMRPGRYQVRARQRHLRSDLVEVELDRPGDRASVQLHLADEPVSDRLRVDLPGAEGGFCLVETDNAAGGQLVQIRGGRAEAPLEPPLGRQVRAACSADGRWIFGEWQGLREALERGVTFDPGASTASLALIGEYRGGGVTISTPGGWNLGQLRMWFGGAPTFSVGETIPNLPAGAYVVRRGDDSRTVVTERRRTSEVDLGD